MRKAPRAGRGVAGLDIENGTRSSSFWYRVESMSRGFKEKRLDYGRAAKTDPYLFPALRENPPRELAS
jgi:hypothetical protein